MILFSLEEYFELSPQCEDIGLTAIKSISNHLVFDIIFVSFISIAISSINQLIKKYINVPNYYSPPFILLSLWSLATTMSLFSMGLFGRQQVSYVFKFIHVTLELLHLSYCLLIWRFVTFANFITIFSLVALFSSVSMPCRISYEFTELGAVLDTANLIVVLLIAKYDVVNRRIILAFLLHATYIWTFLIMSYASTDDNFIATMRIYGFSANSISVLVMVSAMVYTEKIPTLYKIGKEINNRNIYIDKNGKVYADNNLKSIISVILINLLQGMRNYTYLTELSANISFGFIKIKDVQITKVSNPKFIDVTYTSNFLGSLILILFYILFSIYIELHWALCLFYTVLIPSSIIYVLFYIIKLI